MKKKHGIQINRQTISETIQTQFRLNMHVNLFQQSWNIRNHRKVWQYSYIIRKFYKDNHAFKDELYIAKERKGCVDHPNMLPHTFVIIPTSIFFRIDQGFGKRLPNSLLNVVDQSAAFGHHELSIHENVGTSFQWPDVLLAQIREKTLASGNLFSWSWIPSPYFTERNSTIYTCSLKHGCVRIKTYTRLIVYKHFYFMFIKIVYV